MLLRTELAQEKASLAIVRQEVRDQAKREWGIAQSAHAQKVQEVESKLKKEEEEKEKLKVELGEMRIQMKGKIKGVCTVLYRQITDFRN